ncbi:Alcohol dehydrogenase superfamily, zinc-type [Ascosphaera apis ARSEF 7405]|uniref:Alcohol dehydrogenase superfamily, zinc-type n=1 Tax=Ascosphaera apis ARSEF 7405 TaxID=392613 RepID=A0A167YEB8_9EURO|nr:Alcohol dehydrogenase superfamily, zinc-type [Ascosphaera apis ARSEF 7405]
MAPVTMKAVGVEKYGEIDNLIEKEVEIPKAKGHDVLIKVKATSINPVDTKARAGTYDDYPDYYDHVPRPFHILGFDGAGIVVERGELCHLTNVGDHVYYSGSPIRQGANAEYQAVDERSLAKMPKSVNFAQAASLPLTYITAYEALVERLEIIQGEKAGILIINGAGGVGAMATQLAKDYLYMPVIVTTASRPETQEFSKKMGATHVVNHHEDIVEQIKKLDLEGEARMYGTEFMAKSLSFVWALIGTKPYYGVNLSSHRKILQELAELVDRGVIRCNVTEVLPFTLEGIREAHKKSETSKSIGKVVMSREDAEMK